jgi:hypothetical protein
MFAIRRCGIAVGVLALTLGSVGSAVYAQDQERQQDQPRQDQPGPRDQGHDEGRPDEHGNPGDVERYRKAHPRAAARCHDGFFTNTTDRARACSKHGGIDVWLRD